MYVKIIVFAFFISVISQSHCDESDVVDKNQIIGAIANLTSIIQTMSQKLTALENDVKNITLQIANDKISARFERESAISDAHLLRVTVPSSVPKRSGVWKSYKTPEKDDVDFFMERTTGCRYMARSAYGAKFQPESDTTVRDGRARWRRRFAVRGEKDASVRVKWGAGAFSAGYDYIFIFGNMFNAQTDVYDAIGNTYRLQRATPDIMSWDRYSQFFYLQLEDGVLSFGALADSTPWWSDNVVVATGDVVEMAYYTMAEYGMKLLVCA